MFAFPQPESKLQHFLELADSIRKLVNQVAAEGSRLRQTDTEDLTVRNRVLIGLAIKAYNCFERLIQDATASRSEAFHHLKTLAETHIYFQWVGAKSDDNRAKLLHAEVCRCKIGFFNANPELDPDKKKRESLKRRLQVWTVGLEHEWKGFKNPRLSKLAQDTNADMVGWYNRVYRSACESAHISDLLEYMPPPRGSISVTPVTELAALRALIALDFGIQIMWDLLRNLSVIYELGFDETISKFKATLDVIRTQPTTQ